MGTKAVLQPGKVAIPSLDGGYFIPALIDLPSTSLSEAPPVVVVTHGIFTDMYEKGRFDRLTERLNDAGFVAVRFDFSGHGTSPVLSEQFSISRSAAEVRAVYNWLSSHQVKVVGAIGSSFGAAGLLMNACNATPDGPDALVLFNPCLDYDLTFLDSILPWGDELFTVDVQKQIEQTGSAPLESGFRPGYELLTQMRFTDVTKAFDRLPADSVLIIHGTADDKAPYQQVSSLPDKWPSVKLLTLEGSTHAFKDSVASEERAHLEAVLWIAARHR